MKSTLFVLSSGAVTAAVLALSVYASAQSSPQATTAVAYSTELAACGAKLATTPEFDDGRIFIKAEKGTTYVRMSAHDLSIASELVIKGDKSSVVVLLVDESLVAKDLAVRLQGKLDADRVLINAASATGVTIFGSDIQASILAPRADAKVIDSRIEGGLYVSELAGNAIVGLNEFVSYDALCVDLGVPGQQPGQNPGQVPGQQPGQNPGQASGDRPVGRRPFPYPQEKPRATPSPVITPWPIVEPSPVVTPSPVVIPSPIVVPSPVVTPSPVVIITPKPSPSPSPVVVVTPKPSPSPVAPIQCPRGTRPVSKPGQPTVCKKVVGT